eukprot:CAMPEP_0114612326 /NCGR_PEP_ID=MMETSP0168-20121206/4565_1 /TAXON_ID=95228 ORGANISM="Vannella sp., Strain DIVA3 517/6/12" /NCGR_SAMPLE_ID=MMETSP0168 /ASSEMBLY_ACC=CAM_ASM_000044 /LENGTH=384 /DNA_ID=CAMNT_0001823309 /DNA_START=42 /DNA_END=1196 /DNA_ORIENTATION=+
MSAGEYYSKNTERPEIGRFNGFDHIRFIVGNAYQAATYYTARFGFKRVAYRGLETGHRDVVSHVLQQNDVFIVLSSPLLPGDKTYDDHLVQHGDGVKDVAMTVDNCLQVFETAKKNGAEVVREPWEETDEDGTVVMATIKTYGDTTHTFVERKNYKGLFLPNYRLVTDEDPLFNVTPVPGVKFVDHVVGNQPDLEMESVASFYERVLQFHRFWSVDDSIMHTDYSALRSIVMADHDENIKMPINEPANGKRKSQIQEYVDFYSGPGVQHIALNTDDIIFTVSQMRARGTQFLSVPKSYYDNLREKLKSSPTKVTEDMDVLEKLQILVDYDDNGYLLQLFTKPIEDRPTLFYEIIQRHNHQGFGAGNFKALFEAIEREQEARGNL